MIHVLCVCVRNLLSAFALLCKFEVREIGKNMLLLSAGS